MLVDSTVPAAVEQIENTAEVTEDGQEFDPLAPVEPSTDDDQEITPLNASPSLELEKSDGGIAVAPGQSYHYTLSYANAGNQDATMVVLTETVPDYTTFSATRSLPSVWSCVGTTPGSVCTIDLGTLPAGASATARFGLLADYPALAGVDVVDNSATLSDDGLNGGGDVSATDNTPVIAAPDLVVTKESATRVIRRVGDEVAYTITYTNVGDQDATGVVLQETVPLGATYLAGRSDARWSCADGDVAGTVCSLSLGSLGVGEEAAVEFALTVIEEPEDRNIVNVVGISDDGLNGPDQNPNNNLFELITPFPPLVIPVFDQRGLALLVMLIMLLAGRHLRRSKA